MSVEKYTELPKLTEMEVREQAENLFNFFKLTHPFLEDRIKAFHNAAAGDAEQINADTVAIELRPLKRDGAAQVCKNFKLYRFADSEKERFYKFLLELNKKGVPYCLYYSVYCFDNNILAVNQQCKESKQWNNKIAINNSIATQILVMDFDDITEDEFILEKIKLARLGIETIDIMSGHGFQSIILLDQVSQDKGILRKFTELLLKKGFKVDRKIKDSARLMRPPYTYNCKELTKTVENPMIIKTEIWNYTEKRYSLDFIFNSLDTLETVKEIGSTTIEIEEKKITDIEVEKQGQPMLHKATKTVEAKDPLSNMSYDIVKLKELYTMLNIDELPQAVLIMLEGFRRGYANSMLMFLVLYLKELGYPKSTIQEAMMILSQQDKYNYAWDKTFVKQEVDRFYYNKSYSSKGIFFSELDGFGYVSYEFKDKSVVKINNYVFEVIKDVSSKAFLVYMKLLSRSNYLNKKSFSFEDIIEITNIPERTLKRHISDLVDVKLIEKKRGYKKDGEVYKFYLSPFLKTDLGFTKINSFALKTLIKMVDEKELNPTQLSVCIYIKHVCYGKKTESGVSQETIGNVLGLNRTTISKTFKAIEKCELIKRDKEEISDFKFKYKYTIHF